MSRKSKNRDVVLKQEVAEQLIALTKDSIESTFKMPDAGERNKQFYVEGDDNEGTIFTIALYRGIHNPMRHQISARISANGIPLLRLCVNSSPHHNPDGTRISGTHWHVYREGFDTSVAYEADIASASFVGDTILLLDKFNVIKKPSFQGELPL